MVFHVLCLSRDAEIVIEPLLERRDVSESEQKSESVTSMGEHQKDEAGVSLLENGSPWRP